MSTPTDGLFLQSDGKHGICVDATGAPGMLAPALSDLLAALRETDEDLPDCLRQIGQNWGERMVARFPALLAERTGRTLPLAQAPVEPFLGLCCDYLQAHGFGRCDFAAQEPTLTIHIQDGQPDALPLLAGFFEALISTVADLPVQCRPVTENGHHLRLEVFQPADATEN
ncbi:hypothetical protein J8C01_12530 [Chloracidobacterium sp. D]|jgi:hypothetical protein|uniref:hypothetical protein n=1 Tax=Chloracidobacterium sp. D TaxID=2821536 RepID=UPI001B8BACC8|nr:hypothetical protein [Chloracidobacterium sp. D]QUV83495.1 hypothetical protein J8C01_12530 [Chloracidobacterium sp. D]